jgi:hypothetical protein
MLIDFNERRKHLLDEHANDVVEVITYINEAPSAYNLDVFINNRVVHNDVILDKESNSAVIFYGGRHTNTNVVILRSFIHKYIQLSEIIVLYLLFLKELIHMSCEIFTKFSIA